MQKEIDYLRYELDMSRKKSQAEGDAGSRADEAASLAAQVAVLKEENSALLARLENKVGMMEQVRA